jgi:hypothetical protein
MLLKDFLEFKNIIMEEKLSNKNGPCKALNFMVLGYPSKKSQNHSYKTIFEFILTIFLPK